MSNTDGLEKFFLNRKPAKILVCLGKPNSPDYASALSSDVDVTYSHTVKCLKTMNRHGIIECEKKGRKKEIELTDYGEEVAEQFKDLIDVLEKDVEVEDTKC